MLKQFLYPEEFVVDEAVVPVYSPEAPVADEHRDEVTVPTTLEALYGTPKGRICCPRCRRC